MTGTKTNERPGVRAQHRHARMSATKARVVLDLIRGKSVAEARTILQFSERGASYTIAKVLDSAVANAANNNDIPPEELFVATAYADEGPTLKRWRPRARGRATRIRKRTCHITIIVGRYSAEEWDRIRTRQAESGRTTPDAASARARRVAGSRRRSGAPAEEAETPTPEEELAGDEAATEAVVTEAFAEDAEDAGVADGADSADDGGAAAEDAGDEAAADAVVAEDSAEIADEAAAAADEAGETDKKDED
ncbi:50S ribosomal protein L22 [Dermatobacter hominis]|uniref:50S ribosomal protein L22 n=1 Tax=Dermatobacter hominis TaxID=2884263 RepID=UPI0035AC21A0